MQALHICKCGMWTFKQIAPPQGGENDWIETMLFQTAVGEKSSKEARNQSEFMACPGPVPASSWL